MAVTGERIARAARDAAEQVADQQAVGARLVDHLRAHQDDPDLTAPDLIGIVLTLAVQQQKTAARLGDILAAIVGEP